MIDRIWAAVERIAAAGEESSLRDVRRLFHQVAEDVGPDACIQVLQALRAETYHDVPPERRKAFENMLHGECLRKSYESKPLCIE